MGRKQIAQNSANEIVWIHTNTLKCKQLWIAFLLLLLQCNSIVAKLFGLYILDDSKQCFVLHACVLHIVEDNLLWVVMGWHWSLAAFYSSPRYRCCQKCGVETGWETEVLRVRMDFKTSSHGSQTFFPKQAKCESNTSCSSTRTVIF